MDTITGKLYKALCAACPQKSGVLFNRPWYSADITRVIATDRVVLVAIDADLGERDTVCTQDPRKTLAREIVAFDFPLEYSDCKPVSSESVRRCLKNIDTPSMTIYDPAYLEKVIKVAKALSAYIEFDYTVGLSACHGYFVDEEKFTLGEFAIMPRRM